MKKIIIALLMMVVVVSCYSQNNVMDYDNEPLPVAGDYLYLIKGGTVDRNTSKLQFQQNLIDSLAAHWAAILLNEAAIDVIDDTLFQHNLRLLALEGVEALDTTYIYEAIELKVAIGDTSEMLLPLWTDIIANSTDLLAIADTSEMLIPYALLSETSEMISDSLAALLANGEVGVALTDSAQNQGGYQSYYDGTVQDALIAINTTQQRDSLRQYNIISYGADPTAGSTSDEAYNLAIIAANAAGGGVVVVPMGQYSTNDTIYLMSNVDIEADDNAILYTSTGYNGPQFWGGGDGALWDFSIDGGQYNGPSDHWGWSCVVLEKDASANNYATRGRFTNMTIHRANYGFRLSGTNDGWTNSMSFFNIWTWGTKRPFSFEGAANGNLGSNIFIQDGDSCYYAMNIESGRNVFDPVMFWDFGTGSGPATQQTIIFSDDAKDNDINVGQISFDNSDGYGMIENIHPNTVTSGGVTFNQRKTMHLTLSFTDQGETSDTIRFQMGQFLIHDVEIAVSEVFNDSGTDYIDVGFSSASNYLVDNADVSTATFKSGISQNLPLTHPQTGGYYFVASYDGQNNDATTGIADIFIYYTMLSKPVGSTE